MRAPARTLLGGFDDDGAICSHSEAWNEGSDEVISRAPLRGRRHS